jgi:hypothetical protein
MLMRSRSGSGIVVGNGDSGELLLIPGRSPTIRDLVSWLTTIEAEVVLDSILSFLWG